jgi:glycosyltransferase involved in cell wall biosynthesis
MDVATFCKQYLADASMIVVGAPEIMELYRPHLTNLHFANLAYDEMRFQRRKNAPGAGLTLGWTGNPNRDFKGFHSLIVPVIEELKQEGYPITLKTQFSGSLESLADFWQEVDLAVIASEADAGPSLFMEASLCGVPSISTRIGMPKYVIRDGENGIFIERSKEALRAALLRVFEDRVLLADMQEAIRRDYIGLLGFAVQKENWKSLFARVFSTRQSEST